MQINSDVITRTEEQDLIWAELDNLGTSNHLENGEYTEIIPPKPENSQLFETQNSVDLRVLLRDIEIVLINAALDRNNGNTSDAAKDLRLQRTTLIEKIKKYGM